MKKNTAGQTIGCQMINASTGAAFSGSVTVYITGDAGTQAVGSVGSGACASEGNGLYTYVPAQAETNYDHIAFTFIGTGAIPATVQVYPSWPQTGDSFSRLGAPAGASIAADVATRLAASSYTAPPSAATTASSVRTELGTELARIDATVSSRNATTPPTAAANASAVRTELAAELARVDVATSTRLATAGYTAPANSDIAAAKAVTDKLDTALALNAGNYRYTAAALALAPSGGGGGGGDQWLTDVGDVDTYPDGTAGALLRKLDVGVPDAPVIVIPGSPAEVGVCRVYGYLEHLDNRPAAGVDITFELLVPNEGATGAAVASERMVTRLQVVATTDAAGRLIGPTRDPWVDLQRNDLLTPTGTSYVVRSVGLKLRGLPMTLAAETFDLAELAG